MRRVLAALLAVAYLVVVAAVVPLSGGQPTWRKPEPALVARMRADARQEFLDRAQGIADQWKAADLDRWNHRFYLMNAPVIEPGSADSAVSMALHSGWYTLAAPLPPAPATGTVDFADGKERVLPLQSARTAYDTIANVAPDCKGCISLTVTRVGLTSAQVPTSRGPATVPVWAFTVRELDEPVRVVAVAEDTEPAHPDIAIPPLPNSPIAGAIDPLPTDGSRIDYAVDLRTCDADIEPLVWETDLVVVLGAAFTPQYEQACSMDRHHRQVSVALSRPIGDRALVDVFFGFTLEPLRTEPR